MSIKNTVQARAVRPNLVTCRFKPAGTAEPSFTGVGVSDVAYTDTGIYTITLKETHASLLAGMATAQHSGTTIMTAMLGAVSNFGTSAVPTVVVHTLGAAGLEDLAADDSNHISVLLVCEDATGAPGSQA